MLYLAPLLLLLWLVYAGFRDVYRRRASRLPPGPPGLPLVGNALQLPAAFLWSKLHSWAQQYGPFYTIWVMGKPMVILDNVEVAADVLDRMSGATGGRPRSAKSEFYSVRSMFVNEDLGRHFRAGRRSIHSNFNIRATSQFHQIQSEEVAYFALGLIQHPTKSFDDHTHRLADPSRVMEKRHKELVYAMLPQNSRVDVMPFLKPVVERVQWLRKDAENWHNRTWGEGLRLFDEVDARGSPSVVEDLRNNAEKYGLTTEESVWVTVVIYMAGQETTHTALRTAVLGLLHHPHVVRAAQQQVDAVCGSRLPSFDDRNALPYIDALAKEAIRWRPGVPLGIPHKAEQDFEYRGYIVPKGTTLVDNLWGQTRDPGVYPNPDAFDPTRFLDATGNLRPVTPDTRLDLLGFGHGRRVCPGKDFATNGIFIALAILLWAFDFDFPVDAQDDRVSIGTDPLKDYEDHSGFLTAPKPFEVVFTPRKEGLEQKLHQVLQD